MTAALSAALAITPGSSLTEYAFPRSRFAHQAEHFPRFQREADAPYRLHFSRRRIQMNRKILYINDGWYQFLCPSVKKGDCADSPLINAGNCSLLYESIVQSQIFQKMPTP